MCGITMGSYDLASQWLRSISCNAEFSCKLATMNISNAEHQHLSKQSFDITTYVVYNKSS